MNDVLPAFLVSVAGAVLVAACSAGLVRQEHKWVAASFAIHIAFACAQVPLTLSFYGGSDMFLYFSYGEILARMMERDPLQVIPEVTALLLHSPHRLPLNIIGDGTSTGSMSALAAWVFYLLGPSKYAACIAFAMLSLTGKVAMYRVFRANLDPAFRFPGGVATLFVPSFVFWSAGMIKEAVALTGLGWLLFGLHQWTQEGRAIRGWAIMAAGSFPILLIKPYILFPFVLAGVSWYYWARSVKTGRIRLRPAHFVVAAVLGCGGVVVLGHYFPQYAVDTFSTRTAELQQLGRIVRGGSNYELTTQIPTTLAGQFAYAPAALLSALFRPSLLEVHNLLMLANSVETTLLTLLFLRLLFTRNLGNVRRQIMEEPFLVFCVVFVVAFGMAVGLASSNLGSLSRYRSPLLPFFAVLLVVLGRPRRAPSSAREVHEGLGIPYKALSRRSRREPVQLLQSGTYGAPKDR
jgi:hypothetical protein